MLAAAAAMPLLNQRAASEQVSAWLPTANGYGGDPKLTKLYHPGDARSPSAESVGIVDFIDEWVSAPYTRQLDDRRIVLEGLAWMDAEALLRFEKYFAELDESQRRAICDNICYEPNAAAKYARAAQFFTRYRDLTVGGYYSTPAGHQDLGYIGNVPLLKFDGPPAELLRKLGLGKEPA